MNGNLQLLLWAALVIVGIGAMQWGSSCASEALDVYRCRAGLRGTAAGALLGIATAAPEISVNIASVWFGWPDLGLGAALGSNVPALPLIFLLSWLSLRSAHRAPQPASVGAAAAEPPIPVVEPAAVEVQAVPYLLVILLLAGLTLPPRWAGLQPVDGLLLLVAWGVYLARALLRPRKAPAEPGSMIRAPLKHALLGVPAIALGALASVVATRRLGDAFGASDLVVGLFVIGLLCALPESFAAWHLARKGKTTTAVSTAMADGIVSLTVALVPPALVGAAVGDPTLYGVNVSFLVLVLLAYIGLNHFRRGQELSLGRVALFVGGYAVYLAVVVYLLSR
jgi:cation:H+ antiporter